MALPPLIQHYKINFIIFCWDFFTQTLVNARKLSSISRTSVLRAYASASTAFVRMPWPLISPKPARTYAPGTNRRGTEFTCARLPKLRFHAIRRMGRTAPRTPEMAAICFPLSSATLPQSSPLLKPGPPRRTLGTHQRNSPAVREMEGPVGRHAHAPLHRQQVIIATIYPKSHPKKRV